MLRQRGFLNKAKQHFFMDAQMSEVQTPVSDAEGKCGAGTKVVITIGPACQDVAVLSKLLLAGVSCARIDLTWGSVDFHRTSLQNLAAAMKATRRLCAVWIDTVGREIVVRRPHQTDSKGWMVLEKSPIDFVAGSEVVVTIDAAAEISPNVLPVNIPSFPMLVEPGQLLHVGRFLATGAEGGSLFLQVTSTSSTEIRCVAQNSASLSGLLTVVVCHRQYSLSTHDHDLNRELPLLTEHDVSCIRTFGREFELDFVSLSYCNSPEDIWACRETLDTLGLSSTKIVAKVERKAAIHNYDGICAAADAVLLSRGNLGLDFEPEEMALLQKACVSRCNIVGKPIIVTRFVDTMVNTPRPTRAEATDVANAVLDGVDGVMLGAETLRGLYPVQTVDTVMKLCRAAEVYFDYHTHHDDLMGEAFDDEMAMESAYGSSSDLAAKMASLDEAVPRPQARPISVARNHADGARPADIVGSPGGASPSRARGTGLGGAAKYSSFGVVPSALKKGGSSSGSQEQLLGRVYESGAPFLSKVESIASTATRTAEKINAGLIVVMAQTGRTVSLVAKYRPPMPVLAVVVPTLRSEKGLGWQLEGKFLARQCLIMRGVHPMLAAPMTDTGEDLLSEAVHAAAGLRLVKANAYVVCILSQQGSLVVKVIQVNAEGTGIRLLSAQPNKLLKDSAGAANGAAGGAPVSPSYLRRASMSLVGAGAMGADNPASIGGAMLATLTDLDEATAAAAVAAMGLGSASVNQRYGYQT